MYPVTRVECIEGLVGDNIVAFTGLLDFMSVNLAEHTFVVYGGEDGDVAPIYNFGSTASINEGKSTKIDAFLYLVKNQTLPTVTIPLEGAHKACCLTMTLAYVSENDDNVTLRYNNNVRMSLNGGGAEDVYFILTVKKDGGVQICIDEAAVEA